MLSTLHSLFKLLSLDLRTVRVTQVPEFASPFPEEGILLRGDSPYDGDIPPDVHKWTIPTGFILEGKSVMAEFDCAFPLCERSDTDVYIDYIFDVGQKAGLFKASSQSDVLKTKESIRNKYYVNLALNVLPKTQHKESLQKMVAWIFMLFCYDNLIDDEASKIKDSRELQGEFISLIVRVLQKDIGASEVNEFIATKLDPCDQEKARSVLKFGEELKGYELSDEFITEAYNYFSSSVTEMDIDMKSVGSYVDVRRVSGAIASVAALAETCQDEQGDVYGHPSDYLAKDFHWKQMNQYFIDIIWAANDLGGAKEMRTHEPNYIKVRMAELEKTTEQSSQEPASMYRQRLFKIAFKDLLTSINEWQKKYLYFKNGTLQKIRSGEIFIKEPKLTKGLKEAQIAELKLKAEADFLKKCKIRENLITSGHACTALSSRYIDVKEPTLRWSVA